MKQSINGVISDVPKEEEERILAEQEVLLKQIESMPPAPPTDSERIEELERLLYDKI